MNSPVWQGLMQQALVGTQRMDALDDAQWPSAVQALMRDANATLPLADDAHAGSIKVLRAAGAAALWQRAGHVPAAIDPPLALSAAPDDVQTMPSDEAVIRALNAALRDGPESLIRQSWHVLARAGMRLPQQTLPTALDAGARNSALRADLLGVLGACGLWLAQLNPAWKYAAGTDQQADAEQLWSEGSFEQRVAVLRSERESDPRAARERFEAAIKELNAKERLAMLEVLSAKLSMDDEPLLERLLTDRSGDVKQLAAELLSTLPESAHSQRVIAWITLLLKRDGDGGNWTIEPPEKENADWPRDGIAIKVNGFFKGGERAWWLYQLVRMTPPAWWLAHLGMTPEALFVWAGKTEWKRSLWDGLLEAAARAPSREWLGLLTSMQENRLALQSLNSLLTAMPLSEREAYWSTRVKAAPRLVIVLIRIGELMEPGEQLSPQLSAQIVAALSQQALAADSASANWSVRHDMSQALASAALWLDPAALPELLAVIDKVSSADANQNNIDEQWQHVRRIADIRQTLARASVAASS
ncbi:hypothetical protein G7047_19845 [Diaphorobacter sp. HDW4A]|uniref:DUF5691 domain-containing protein n=1 Tax=Diaphorobacter sp. HDW4A TaxID=2714924 RepID=UPI001409E963|nr:DUF5691 domain-containing protein [Diaphorobacter sp. HDW4A]QIL81924.1 hypothetical protein G7047_19845 [Diaphorobacter sp. HDW4A]